MCAVRDKVFVICVIVKVQTLRCNPKTSRPKAEVGICLKLRRVINVQLYYQDFLERANSGVQLYFFE